MTRKFALWKIQTLLLAVTCLLWLPRLQNPQSGILTRGDQALTDLKFRFRGPEAASGNIVVVDIDSDSIERMGRWPWRRDFLGLLVDKVFASGAKTVGLDIVFSEKYANDAKPDAEFAARLEKYRGRVTLPWITDCLGDCEGKKPLPPIESPLPPGLNSQDLPRFADAILTIPQFSQYVNSQGFANALRDPDGVVREAHYFFQSQGKTFPSLALAFASQAMGVKPEEAVSVVRSPVYYLGPSGTVPTVSAFQLLQKNTRDLASEVTPLTGKHALIGISALAVGDRIATPFGPSVAGVEVQATIADQILSKRFPRENPEWVLIFTLLLCPLLIWAASQLENLWLFVLFPVVGILTFILDFKLAFPQGNHLPSALAYANTFMIFSTTFVGRYYQESAHRKFLKAAFSRYVSPEVVRILANRPGALQLGGERKQVTTLFCDLRDFTAISEKLDPQVLSHLLNEYFTLLTEAVFRQQGTVDKYIGDALMAFFGAPLDQPDHSRRACLAAIDMVEQIQSRKAHFQKNFGVNLNLGVGLNTGSVSVGNMGSEQRMNYTVLGDSVNLASRLEGVTKYYGVGILTSHYTIEAIQKSGALPPPYRVLDRVRVKGKSEAIELIELSHQPWNEEGLSLYEKARTEYAMKSWNEAIALFEKASPLLNPGGEDGPCKLFISRCQEYKKHPPDFSWDGIEDLAK